MNRHLSRLAIALPLVAAAIAVACSEGTGGGISGPLPADVVIPQGAQLLGFQAYDPDTITVHLNGASSVKVVWRNDDQVGGTTVTHTVTDTTAANDFSITLNAGENGSITFVSAGSYPYKCNFHQSMRGLVLVEP